MRGGDRERKGLVAELPPKLWARPAGVICPRMGGTLSTDSTLGTFACFDPSRGEQVSSASHSGEGLATPRMNAFGRIRATLSALNVRQSQSMTRSPRKWYVRTARRNSLRFASRAARAFVCACRAAIYSLLPIASIGLMFLFRLEIDIDYEKFRTAETAVADEYDALMQVA